MIRTVVGYNGGDLLLDCGTSAMGKPRAVTIVGMLVLLALGACGDDIGSKQLGEPCTRTSQCKTELSCVEGVCRDPSMTTADSPDAGDAG